MKCKIERSYLVHAVASCEDCDFEEEFYETAVALGRKHAKLTGYTVAVETGYCKRINPK